MITAAALKEEKPTGTSAYVRAAALGVLMLGGPLLLGCATTDELDAMRATMSATLGANKRAVDAQLRQLEDARKKTEEQQAQLVKRIDDLDSKLSNHQSALDEQIRQLTLHRDTMARLSDGVKNSSNDIRELQNAIQSENGAIAKILDAEESFHREGLRSIQAVRSELGGRKSNRGRGTAGLWRDLDAELGLNEERLR